MNGSDRRTGGHFEKRDGAVLNRGSFFFAYCARARDRSRFPYFSAAVTRDWRAVTAGERRGIFTAWAPSGSLYFISTSLALFFLAC